MYLTKKLFSQVFEIPYDKGYRNLQVLSGYVSPSFVEFILSRFEDLILDITVGMISNEGISISHHHAFLNLSRKYKGRINIDYQIESPGNHRKVYYWMENDFLDLPPKLFLGSANFSYNGFFRQKELLIEATFDNVNDIFEDLQTMNCEDSLISSNIKMFNLVPGNKKAIKGNKELPEKVISIEHQGDLEYVDISLLAKGEVPKTSGINWGQREGRDKNQAYLAVPLSIHKKYPDFFPGKAEPFLMLTDDGESMICVMAQQNRKAIHTTENNSILGAYLRKRLGVPDKAFVHTEDVINYGKTFVRIYKIDAETYYMDFSV